jgi:hypothetical protein
MSPYTFGNYKASHSLVKILEELNMKFLTRKLFLAYSKYHISLKELQKIEDKRTYITMHLLLRNYYLNSVDDIYWSQENILQGDIFYVYFAAFKHMKNIIVTDYREALRKRGYSCLRKK